MEQVSAYVSLVSGILTSLALVVGGIWAIYRFGVQREHASNPQVEIEHVVLPYSEETCLAVFTVRVGNIGKTVVHAERISFGLKVLDRNRGVGATLHWNDGPSLVEDYDIMRESNPEDDTGVYMLEPGDRYDELVTAVVPKEGLYLVRVEFEGREGDLFWTYVVVST